jgi:uncharacterized protein YkwD
MESEGYRVQRAAENIAAGDFTLDTLMNAWMKSPPHRRNILGPYSQVGVSRAIDSRGLSYWCVTFGKPLPTFSRRREESSDMLVIGGNGLLRRVSQ